MITKAGIISDTHLIRPNSSFGQLVNTCFSDCSVIIHGGDLTDLTILDVFAGKTVYAVHGNMCRGKARQVLPAEQRFTVGDFSIGLTHGDRCGPDIESGLYDLFADLDCMIYGHTHRPVCYRHGGKLIINPGSFKPSTPWGAPATYAILEAGTTLQAKIFEVRPTQIRNHAT
jgi:hypothetical protein